MSKKCTKCGEVKELEGFSKNCRNKDGLLNTCKICDAACKKVYYVANREKELAYAKTYYKANREKLSAKAKAWFQANPERNAANGKAWRKANRDKDAAVSAKRRAAKLERTVPWADLVSIQAIYSEAKRLTETTGVKHHVDHVIPLQGELVSGLHVESNLQVLTAQENCSKSNKFNTNN